MSKTRWTEEHEYWSIHYCERSATLEETSETSSYLETDAEIVFDKDCKDLTVREYLEDILFGKKALKEIQHCFVKFNGKDVCLGDIFDNVIGEGDFIKMYSQEL